MSTRVGAAAWAMENIGIGPAERQAAYPARWMENIGIGCAPRVENIGIGCAPRVENIGIGARAAGYHAENIGIAARSTRRAA